MATVPPIYTNNVPIQNIGGLTPLQLAAANYMISGSPQPFGINQEFLTEMIRFGSSENISPLAFDPKTGLPNPFPPLILNVSAEYYFVRGEDLYIYRRAEDCGPDENRFEEVLVGKVRDVATGTYAYYGRPVRSGSAATGGGGSDGSGGSGGSDGGGGYSSSTPGDTSSMNDTNTTNGDSTNGYGSSNGTSFA